MFPKNILFFVKFLKNEVDTLNTVGDSEVISDKSKKSIKNYIENLNYFVFLSKFDKNRFLKELNFSREKAVVIRNICGMQVCEKSKLKDKKLIMISRLDNKQKKNRLSNKCNERITRF